MNVVDELNGPKSLFVYGEFTSHSGLRLPFKIECDSLTDDDIDCIAKVMASRHDFSHVYGIPRGGLRLQAALMKHISNNSEHALIVDDVYTTGQSMERARIHVVDNFNYHWNKIIGMVIWSWTKPPKWIIYSMNQLWEPN